MGDMSARIGHIVALALLVVGVCGGGCTATIVPPPAAVGRTAPVLIADYGYHSTLILPRAQGGLIEYAYGDWEYFGQNKKSVATALHALLASDQATLGRRVIDREPDPTCPEDMSKEHVFSHANYLWDMRVLDLMRKGDMDALRALLPEFIEATGAEIKAGGLFWMLSAMGFPKKPARVHGYWSVIGTGNAVVEWPGDGAA